MTSFLNSAELKRLETGSAEIWQELVINLFWKDISNFLAFGVLPTLFIDSSVPDMHFRFSVS